MTIKTRFLFVAGLLTMAVYTAVPAQQLRDAFRRVNQSVVTVRTKSVNIAAKPGQVMSIVDGLGSGVLISTDGKVLTAAHVVQTADAALVEFSDGQYSIARVIASDVRSDVALLQLKELPKGISPATLGDSDKVDVGDQIFVIGAPYGISQTLTAGHVSGRRQMDKEGENRPYIELLQTDAAVNGGNSGSPMFDMNGQVVGIVSTIMSQSGGSEGLAFATASNTAKRFLLDRKPFWSGIDGMVVTGALAQALNLPQPAGFLVQRVGEGSVGSRLRLNGGTLQVSFCSLAFMVLTAASLGASLAATTGSQDDTEGSTRRLHSTSRLRQSASTRKSGERSIIFVGGEKRRQGAASRSNPKLARRSRGSLNPQPIPPGKSRLHPPGPCRKSQGTPCS